MNVIKLISRSFIFPLIRKTHLSETIASFSKNQNLILNYHGVVKHHDLSLSRNHLPLKQFEEQMEYFKRNFEVLSVEEIFQNKIKNKSKSKTLAITFDDGYLNNLNNALPVLESLTLPATIFVTGQSIVNPALPLWYDLLDLLNSKLKWNNLKVELQKSDISESGNHSNYSEFKNYIKTTNPEFKNKILSIIERNNKLGDIFNNIDKEYWQLLNSTDLKKLSNNKLIEIGSHGLTHSNLDRLSETELKDEIYNSKKLLSDCIQNNVSSIAFPDGAYNDKVKIACRKNGYERMLAVSLNLKSEQSESDILPRFSISNTTTSNSIIIQSNLAFNKKGF